MNLSTKGRYGVRFMLDLALNSQDQPVFLKDIAQRQEISEKYLWHLVDLLKNAGLVNSLRGAHGGYVLAKPAEEISLRDIVTVLEGDLCLVGCVNNPAVCDRAGLCVMRDIWKETNDVIYSTLESFSLKDIVERQRDKIGAAGYAI
ncbi:MAG: Rrf2 family transcriptional regulator [Candidatus Omnitrophota bacterium]|jgi:Rrf2 family protein